MHNFMTPPPDAYKTQWGPIWLSEDGIIINLGAKSSQTKEEVAEYISYIRKAGAGKPRPFLVEVSHLRSASKEVRDEYDHLNAGHLVTAMAMVTHSGISKMIGNILIGINNSKIPMKLFTDPANARAWLQQYIDHTP